MPIWGNRTAKASPEGNDFFMKPENLPIGYWIKKADQLLTEGIDRVQAQFGLSRTGWQVLNAIKENGNNTKEGLIVLMKPFAGVADVEKVLEQLGQEGLIEHQQGPYSLTQKGLERHETCLAGQKDFRLRCMKDISGQAYETTVSTLRKMVENLEPTSN